MKLSSVLYREYTKLTPGDVLVLSIQVYDVGDVKITAVIDGIEVVRTFDTTGLGTNAPPSGVAPFNNMGGLVDQYPQSWWITGGVIMSSYDISKTGAISLKIESTLKSRGAVVIPAPPEPTPYLPNKFERVKIGRAHV